MLLNQPSLIATDLVESARRTPTRTAVVDGSFSLTLAELNGHVGTLARLILERRAEHREPADSILPILGATGVWSLVAIQAAIRAGVAFTTLDASNPPSAIQRLFERLDRPRVAIVAGPELVHLVPDGVHCLDARCDVGEMVEPQPVQPNAKAVIIFTSGSTGQPKGVIHDWDLLASIYTTLPAGEPDAIVVRLAPFSFVAGLATTTLPASGRMVSLMDPSQMDPLALLDRLERDDVEVLGLVSSLAATLLDRWPPQRRLHRLTSVVVFGEPFSWQQVPALRRLVSPEAVIRCTFGASEAPVVAFKYEITPDHPIGVGRVPLGRPVRQGGVRLEAMGSAPDDPRQIVVRDYVAHGYLGEPDMTAARFGVDPDGVRWWRSGDIAEQAADGSYRHIGRLDDLIKINGKLVEPAEPERVLRGVSGIRNVIVLPHTTPKGGSRLVAHLELETNAEISPTTVRERLSSSLAPHLIPAMLIRHHRLPLNARSKIDRVALQTGGAEPWRAQPARPPSGPLEQLIVDNVADVLELDTVCPDDDIWDLGLDSLGAIELAARLSDAGWGDVDVATLAENSTAASIAKIFAGLAPARTSGEVRLNANGSQPPIFCFPGRGANSLEFRSFARALGPDQPVVVIEPHGLHYPGRPDRTVATAARRAATAIQRQNPVGRVVLVGYSAGGVVAFEVGHQLRQQGREVHVVLLDAPVVSGGAITNPGASTPSYRHKLAARSAPENARAALRKALLQAQVAYRSINVGKPSTSPARRIVFARIAKQAILHYHPAQAEFPVTMFRIDDSEFRADWASFAPHLQTIIATGSHYTMLEPPHVQALAAHISRILVDTHADSAAGR